MSTSNKQTSLERRTLQHVVKVELSIALRCTSTVNLLIQIINRFRLGGLMWAILELSLCSVAFCLESCETFLEENMQQTLRKCRARLKTT